MIRVVDDAGAAEVDAPADLLCRAAEDDDHLVQGGRVGGGDHELQQGPPVDRQQLLGSAHPAGRAGGQNQAG